ncbi:MAG TPA: helix-turn-helix transcriptional regulator [Niabella sp.]|nr:helix-turn-helix transcriptional regulator [Niabella sp.]
MISLISPSKAQQTIARNVREKRLSMELTQDGLAARSGVPLPTLRKFEQKGIISLEGLLKLLQVLGGMEVFIDALKPSQSGYASIDEVLKGDGSINRNRGRKK